MKNILLEISLVSIIIVGCILYGDVGITEIFTGHDGAGAMIACFGILWFIGAFIRLSTGIATWLTSMSIAMGLIVFGYTLHTYGFFCAICVLGGYSLFLAYIVGYLVPKLAVVFFTIGLTLMIIGLPFRKFSTPTKVAEIETKVEENSDLHKMTPSLNAMNIH